MKYLGYFLVGSALGFMVVAAIDHLVFHPEWTNAEMFRKKWVVLVCSILTAANGAYLINRAKEAEGE